MGLLQKVIDELNGDAPIAFCYDFTDSSEMTISTSGGFDYVSKVNDQSDNKLHLEQGTQISQLVFANNRLEHPLTASNPQNRFMAWTSGACPSAGFSIAEFTQILVVNHGAHNAAGRWHHVMATINGPNLESWPIRALDNGTKTLWTAMQSNNFSGQAADPAIEPGQFVFDQHAPLTYIAETKNGGDLDFRIIRDASISIDSNASEPLTKIATWPISEICLNTGAANGGHSSNYGHYYAWIGICRKITTAEEDALHDMLKTEVGAL